MPYALVAVENKEQHPWPEGLDFYVHKWPTGEGMTQIAESTWLINLDTDLIVLGQIIVSSHKAGMPCHVLVTDQKPNVCSHVPPKKP